MAKKTFVELVDDLDGGPATETVSFSLDNVGYEIDLSGPNAHTLRDHLAVYSAAARRVGGQRQPRSRPGAEGSRDLDAIRAWARTHGHTVADRGRVSKAVLEAFDSAH